MFVDEFGKTKWHSSNKNRYESLGYKYTKIGDEFEVKISDLLITSCAKVRFICDICNGENQITEESKYKNYSEFFRNENNSEIHCCGNRKCRKQKILRGLHEKGVPLEQSFGYLYPERAKLWSDKNDRSSFDYHGYSNDKVWWKCIHGIHPDYEAVVGTQRFTKNGCPYCNHKKVVPEESLVALKPEVAKMWHPTMNGDLIPIMFSPNSGRKAWWQCPTGNPEHVWNAQITTVSNSNGSGCPFCKGLKTARSESLGNTKPDLMKEWNHTKNSIDPFDILPNSNKKVWWKCVKCKHEWYTSPNCRCNSHSGCPECASSGFKKNKPGILYLVRWHCNNEKEFLKIGITNRTSHERLLDQIRETEYTPELLREFCFDDGKICYDMEQMILKNFDFGIVSKEEFPDGFTETTDIKNLDAILELIESNM